MNSKKKRIRTFFLLLLIEIKKKKLKLNVIKIQKINKILTYITNWSSNQKELKKKIAVELFWACKIFKKL